MARARSYWLVKSEPGTYSWERFAEERGTCWSGVRNPLARSHLAGMAKGDLVLFDHSGDGKEVVGIARVTREAYPDPTAADAKWLAVDLAPLKPLEAKVTLAAIKAEKSLADIPLVRMSRLSVSPLPKPAFERILALAKTKP
jgi:predicted RNA-binding protein with PUA-like domain